MHRVQQLSILITAFSEPLFHPSHIHDAHVFVTPSTTLLQPSVRLLNSQSDRFSSAGMAYQHTNMTTNKPITIG